MRAAVVMASQKVRPSLCRHRLREFLSAERWSRWAKDDTHSHATGWFALQATGRRSPGGKGGSYTATLGSRERAS